MQRVRNDSGPTSSRGKVTGIPYARLAKSYYAYVNTVLIMRAPYYTGGKGRGREAIALREETGEKILAGNLLMFTIVNNAASHKE